MGELSIEEKAKAYDEAIEIARKINSGEGVAAPPDWTTCEVIFPELKESEDERIRKALLNAFQESEDSLYMVLTPHRRESFIAWLEKQGSQNLANSAKTYKVEPKFKVGDYIERKDGLGCHAKIIFVGGNVYGCEKLIHSEDESPFFEFMFENQDEFKMSSDFKQKSACNVEPKFKVGDVIRNKWSNRTKTIIAIDNSQYILDDGMPAQPLKVNINAQDNWELVEQNPAWSEEDEYVYNEILKRVKNKKLYEHDLEYIYKWLNSLRPQPKQEWSEEDEKAINDIMWIIEAYRKNGFNETHIQIANASENWLKSLEDRYTWKPSDKQMEALKVNVDRLIMQYPGYEIALKSLYDDLKKLKG